MNMLQSVRKWLGYHDHPQLAPSKAGSCVGIDPPRLLVRVEISSPTFSLSTPDVPPVVITLKAQVEGMEPITVHTRSSLLDPRVLHMFSEGFSFRDIETGNFSRRLSVDICIFSNDIDAGEQEIPPIMSSAPPYEVQHRLFIPKWMTPGEVGFEVGHTYEIGFTSGGGSVAWWRMGKRDTAYPSGRTMPQRKNSCGSRWLKMEPINTATFTVVE